MQPGSALQSFPNSFASLSNAPSDLHPQYVRLSFASICSSTHLRYRFTTLGYRGKGAGIAFFQVVGRASPKGNVPGGPSFMTTLDHGGTQTAHLWQQVRCVAGVARESSVATGKLNELEAGNYKICFATRSSELVEY